MTLTEWRRNQGLSQNSLAQKLYVNPGTIVKWEKGLPITPMSIEKWIAVFDINPVKEFGLPIKRFSRGKKKDEQINEEKTA